MNWNQCFGSWLAHSLERFGDKCQWRDWIELHQQTYARSVSSRRALPIILETVVSRTNLMLNVEMDDACDQTGPWDKDTSTLAAVPIFTREHALDG